MPEPKFRREDETIEETIARLLSERRPDRFVTKDAADVHDDDDMSESDVETTAWLDQIAGDIGGEVKPEELQRVVIASLRSAVGRVEGSQCRKVNDVLRRYLREPSLFPPNDPAVNPHLLNLPVAVVTRKTIDGKTKVLHEHVALRAMTADDFRAFAIEERRRAAKEFAARNSACEAAEAIADAMDDAGAGTFGDWYTTNKPKAPDQDDDE